MLLVYLYAPGGQAISIKEVITKEGNTSRNENLDDPSDNIKASYISLIK